MGVPGSANFLLAGAQGYQIERSLRFNSADSAYLNRTPASAGNQTTWTWSGWIKRAALTSGGNFTLFSAGSASQPYTVLAFTSDQIQFDAINASSVVVGRKFTTQVFRDSSAWYHFVLTWDTTNGTAADRMRVYVNGIRVTSFSLSTDPASSATTQVNTTAVHYVGAYPGGGNYLDGYLTEIHFIDGQALTPSSFGETDTITGVWKPKAFSGGSYGTNGFYLKFADNSGTTSTTLGKDSSPNGNNFTPNNFSVTAGAGNDSMIDTPTPYADGGNGRGNYATLNPLNQAVSNNLSDGNLRFTSQAANWNSSTGTIGVSSGKWYWEVNVNTTNANGTQIGVCESGRNFIGGGTYPGQGATGYSYYSVNGQKFTNGAGSTYGATYTNGDVIGVALDMDAGTLTFYKNNASQGQAFSGISGVVVPGIGIYDTGNISDINFGQRAFAYTPPSGFLALNTQNLPEPSIKKPSSYMDVVTYTGTGSALTPTSSLGFSPDLVWIKSRSAATDHALYDAVRGVEKRMESNNGDVEVTSDGGVTAFNSFGFTLGTLAQVNTNTATYCAWCWDESATPGFDIVTYAGNSTNRTIAHSLGVTPSFLIVKNRSASFSWRCWFTGFTGDQYISLNETSPKETLSTMWGSATPTSTTFAVGTRDETNNAGNNYVAYLWSEVAGFSKFGSYTGNGSSDGPFVFCGFRPRWVMTKRTDTTSNWMIMDAGRNPSNVADNQLYPNRSDAEAGASSSMDLTSNGFKLRNTGSDFNAATATYIFAAFAESPQKYSLAR